MHESLLQVPGIGPVTAALLDEAGISDAAALADADEAMLATVRGVGPLRAAALRREAHGLLTGDPNEARAHPDSGPETHTNERAPGRIETSATPEKKKKKKRTNEKKSRKKDGRTPGSTSKQLAKWERRAAELRKEAKRLTKKAMSTKSKRKRKRRLRDAEEARAAAKEAKRKVKRLSSG